MTETIHACPPNGSGVMPCCRKTPFEAPPTDRMSDDPAAVTCGEPPTCVHPEGYDGECPCPPKCGCCKTTPAPERKAKLEGPGADGQAEPDPQYVAPEFFARLHATTAIESDSACAHCGDPGHTWDDCEAYTAAVAADTPAPASQLRDQIAAAIKSVRLGDDETLLDETNVHLAADAVLAVPAIRRLAETRDALRHATGDRDAYDQEQQQMREELAEARGQIERVRKVVAERRTELAEYEAEHEPSGWSDAVSVTCSRVEDALRIFPEPAGTPCPDDPQEQP
ncbi:hypothetical protein ACH492_22275 [Streptomyces sp. NPDC019443]|uniref:hypothetical protein n=1 Tax=Streptomyces sp. NPDC019443 TaxID=3365061 RepID=UPI0037A9E6BA